MAWDMPRLSRRDFLKVSGVGTAGLGLLATAEGIVKPPPAAAATEGDQVTYGICNFCSSLCNIRVSSRMVGGVRRVIKLDGNANSTLNRGKICARGQAGLRQTYDPDRFKQPLVRVEGSKRGEWNFRAVSWEEAWQYIQRRAAAAEIKPWEWTMVGGWTSCVFYMNWSVPFAIANEIPNIIASPMQHCVTTGHLGTDSVTGNFNVHDEILPDYDNAKYILLIGNNASIAGVSTCRVVRFAEARRRGAKVVALDPRLSETAAKADEWLAIRPGTDLDFCLALLREMLDKQYYDQDFLRQHTNMPFLVQEDAQGRWRLLRDAEGRPQALQEGSEKIHALPKFANTNLHNSEGETFVAALFAPAGMMHKGKRVMTVMQAQIAAIAECTPEWAEKQTDIPADTIRRIANEFGNTRPAIVDPGWHGARYGNQQMARRVQAMIQALNGGIDKEGGWLMSGEFHHKAAAYVKAKAKGETLPAPLVTVPGLEFANTVIGAFSKGENFSHGYPGWSWAFSAQQKAAGKDWVALPVMADEGLKESVEGKLLWREKPYRTRAIFINAANPVRHYYPDTYWKDLMGHPDMALIICLDVLPSDTTPYADVILPSSTYLERDEPNIYGNGVNPDLGVVTRYAAVAPLYDTQEAPDILLKLTEIISGNVAGFLANMEGLAGVPAAAVKHAHETHRSAGHRSPFHAACRDVAFAETAKRLHITPEALDEALRAKGVYYEESWRDLLEHAAVPRKIPAMTPSGRIEFYSSLFEALQEQGANAPHFNVLAAYFPAECRPGKAAGMPLGGDEFYFAYGKTPTVSYGSTNSNNPIIAAVNTLKKDIYTGVWIHPDAASRLGIDHGDMILLTNIQSGQQADGHAYITRQVRRDTVFIHSSFGVENPQLTRSFGMGGTATNKLIPHTIEPVVAGFRSQEFTVRIQKHTV
ncbi:MAG: molybdopterin-dependent oxidoreductase [Rhodocyclaceae bacterium]